MDRYISPNPENPDQLAIRHLNLNALQRHNLLPLHSVAHCSAGISESGHPYSMQSAAVHCVGVTFTSEAP